MTTKPRREPDPPAEAPAEAPAARALRIAREGARLRVQHERWARMRLEAVVQLHRDGFTQQDIADLLQVSKPRAGQLLNEARAAGLLDDDQEQHPVAV